jgi:hypothetical protein
VENTTNMVKLCGFDAGKILDRFAALALERGEHKVHAELLDDRGQRLVNTETITFYVKQSSVRTNLNKRRPITPH